VSLVSLDGSWSLCCQDILNRVADILDDMLALESIANRVKRRLRNKILQKLPLQSRDSLPMTTTRERQESVCTSTVHLSLHSSSPRMPQRCRQSMSPMSLSKNVNGSLLRRQNYQGEKTESPEHLMCTVSLLSLRLRSLSLCSRLLIASLSRKTSYSVHAISSTHFNLRARRSALHLTKTLILSPSLSLSLSLSLS
jgi:hypothetical protein